MEKEKPIKKVTIAVDCVVGGVNYMRGDDVTIDEDRPEDGKYLVGARRAVPADSEEAKAIKAEVSAAKKKAA